jgi:hypothetical protein
LFFHKTHKNKNDACLPEKKQKTYCHSLVYIIHQLLKRNMAHLEVKPKPSSNWWLWIIIIIIVVAAAVYFYNGYTDGSVRATKTDTTRVTTDSVKTKTDTTVAQPAK